MIIRLFKNKSGFIYNSLALLYISLAYVLGFAGLFSEHWGLQLLSTLILAHSLIISSYILHECAHNTVMKLSEHNARLGRLLMWVNGSCYGQYEDIRYKHFRHHVENGDLCWFEYRHWLQKHPYVLKAVLLLEYLYIPAHEVLMHAVLVIGSFVIPQRKSQRLHNLTVIAVRGTLYALLLWFYPVVALLYAVAYMLMMVVLRFMDNLQHDYGGTHTLFDKTPLQQKGDKVYEQIHTFSNPLSTQYVWLNLLVLNFGFHNAHHAKPITPWFELPALHHQLFGENTQSIIPFMAQWQCYSRYRVKRVMQDEDIDAASFLNDAKKGQTAGINAVSFLTAF